MKEIWHRFEEYSTAPPVDEFDNICGPSQVHIRHIKLRVVRYTSKGVRLTDAMTRDNWSTINKLVLHNSRKKYACPTIEEAITSFKARKNKQIRIYKAKIDEIRRALQLIENKLPL